MNIEALSKMECPYSFITGLRGPDHDRDDNQKTLKRTLTTRLRSILFSNSECLGSWNNRPLDPIDVKQILFALSECQAFASLPRAEAYHFVYHLYDAMKQVADHEIWNGYGEDLVTLLYHWIANPEDSSFMIHAQSMKAKLDQAALEEIEASYKAAAEFLGKVGQ